MSWVLALPLLIPFAAAIAALLAPQAGVAPVWASIAGSALHLAAALALAVGVAEGGVLATGLGGWSPPVGIALVADALSALLIVVVAAMGLVIAAFSGADIDRRRSRAGWHALYQLLIGGATGAFLTGDLFNLYVWFEVMVIASFGLVVLGGGRAQIDAGVKYMAMNLVGTITFLASIGMVHGLTGTLTLADLPARLADAPPAAANAAALLLFGALAMKAGLFPLWFWLPAAHHTPPASVKAIFAVTLTKTGMYSVLRVFTLVFPDSPVEALLMPVGILTMALGVVLAAAQSDIHRILSAHILSQIGYVAMGLALGSRLALTAAVFYMLHNIVVKATLLMIAGVGYRMTGSYALARTGGLYAGAPLLSAFFLLSALSMAGLPPFSGFWGKLAFVQAGAEAGDMAVIVATLGVGLFTLYSMSKIWVQGYLKPHPAARIRALPEAALGPLLAPLGLLVAAALALGLAPEPFFAAAGAAADALLDPRPYIAAVMGETP